MTTLEQAKKIYTVLKSLVEGLPQLVDVIAFIFSFKRSRALTPYWSYHEFKEAITARTWRGYTPDELAPKDHEHPEYYKKDDVVYGTYNVNVRGAFVSVEDLALRDHDHDGYYLYRDEFVVSTDKLGGVPASDFAPAQHDHDDRYLKRDDTVLAAYEIGGYKASDFATKDHDHDGYYYFANDVVDDARMLVDGSGNEYTEASFAPADHEHPQYYTLDEFMKTFLLKDEPYWVSEKIKVDVYTFTPDMSTLDPREFVSEYELLQSPYIEKGMRPEAIVDATVSGPTTYDARVVLVKDVGVPAGRYVAYDVSTLTSGNIIAVLPSIKVSTATEDAPVQMPLIVGWNGTQVYLYAMPFPGGGAAVLTDLLLLVEA